LRKNISNGAIQLDPQFQLRRVAGLDRGASRLPRKNTRRLGRLRAAHVRTMGRIPTVAKDANPPTIGIALESFSE